MAIIIIIIIVYRQDKAYHNNAELEFGDRRHVENVL